MMIFFFFILVLFTLLHALGAESSVAVATCYISDGGSGRGVLGVLGVSVFAIEVLAKQKGHLNINYVLKFEFELYRFKRELIFIC